LIHKKKNIVYVAALLYVLVTGHSFLFTKIALEGGGPIDILAHRFVAAFLGLVIAMAFGWVTVSFKKNEVLRILPLAIFYPLSFFGFQTVGLMYATSAEAGIITAAAPIFTLVFASIFLKEKSTALQSGSIIVSVIGVVYVGVMKGATLDTNNILGIVLLALSALSLAGYNVLARSLTKSFTNIELTAVMITISFLTYNLIAVIYHISHGTIAAYVAPLKSGSYLLSIIYLGVLSSLMTSILSNYMLSKLPASRAGTFLNLVTVVTILAGVFILKEEIHTYHLIGVVLIVSGVIGANYFKPKKSDEVVNRG